MTSKNRLRCIPVIYIDATLALIKHSQTNSAFYLKRMICNNK